jgi:hypothetical protein
MLIAEFGHPSTVLVWTVTCRFDDSATHGGDTGDKAKTTGEAGGGLRPTQMPAKRLCNTTRYRGYLLNVSFKVTYT